MSEYSDERLQGALQRVLVRQPVLRKNSSGEPATDGNFSRLYENAALLLLTRPQAVYQLAYLARNNAVVGVSVLAASVVEALLALMDSVNASVPVSNTSGLAVASRGLRAASRVTDTGASVSDVASSLRKYTRGLDQFIQELRPNLRQREGTRDLTAARVGLEALKAAVAALDAIADQWVSTFTDLAYLRTAAPGLDTGRLRRTASTMLLSRVQLGVDAAKVYYAGTPTRESAATASTVALNLLAGRASLQAVERSRAASDPKARSKSLNQAEGAAFPEGTSLLLHVVGDVTPASLLGAAPLATTLGVGTSVTYIPSGAPVRTVLIPGAGRYAIIGSTDLSGPVTINTGDNLYVEIGGITYPVPLTPGTSDITQIIADINAASLSVTASQFGATGRLVLSSAAAFSLVAALGGESTPVLTSDDIAFPATVDWGGSTIDVVVVDSLGVHRQSYTFLVGFFPASVADVITALQVGGFDLDGATTVLVLSDSGDKLVLSATEAGGSTSLTLLPESTVITQGFATWPTTVALGRSAATGSAATRLGLASVAVLETPAQVVLDAFADAEVDGLLTATVDAAGVLTLTSTDVSVESSIEITGGTGLSGLGLTARTALGVASSVELRDSGTPFGLAVLGIVQGDQLRVLDETAEYTATVSATPTGITLKVDTGLPATLSGCRFVLTDALSGKYSDLENDLRRATILMSRSRVPNIGVLAQLSKQLRARTTQPYLSPGEIKKFAGPLLEVLSILHADPEGAADLDVRLAEFGLSRPTAAVTFHVALSGYDQQADTDTIQAVDSMVQAFEERGYDRASQMLLRGRMADFLDLTPVTASQSGNLKSAMRNMSMVIKGPRSTEGAAASHTAANLTTRGSAPAATPIGTRE